MKKLIPGFIAALFVTASVMAGSGLTPQDEKAIKDAGLAVYPGAVVVLAGPGAMGVQFATADTPIKVRSWYQERNADWAIFDYGDMWAMYDGKPGLNPLDVMSKTQVLINTNENLPIVHGLDKNVTTEIVIILSTP